MSKFVRDDFIELVKTSIVDETLREQALQDVRPCLSIVERERFTLRPEKDLDIKKLIAIVEEVADWDVTDVAAMSLDDPFPQSPWLSSYAYERSKGDIIGMSFFSRFTRLPKNSVDDIALDSDVRTALYETVQRAMSKRLRDAADETFRGLFAQGIDVHLAQDLRYGLSEIIYRYLCFAAAGEREEAERFGKLLRKQVKNPILGLRKNGGERHKGTLLVLCA